jgi:hypothetical protein
MRSVVEKNSAEGINTTGWRAFLLYYCTSMGMAPHHRLGILERRERKPYIT